MAVLNSGLEQAFKPEDYAKLLDLEIAAKSVAFQAATVVTTGSESIRFPVLTDDMASGWYVENTAIDLTDPSTDEIVVTPKAVKALTQVSTEAAEDTNPEAAGIIGKSLGRSIANKIDAAFLGNVVTNGPSGLQSVSFSTIDTGTVTLTSLDPFHDAKKLAQDNAAELSVFLVAPDVANTLAKVKTATGSTVGLLDDVSDGTTLAGVPVIVSRFVAAGEVWGLDKSQVFTVQRRGTTLAVSKDAAFGFDAVQIRGTARVAFGFGNPAGIIRLYDAA